jgi:hypothetical protein
MNSFESIYTIVFFAFYLSYMAYKINKLSQKEPQIVNIEVIDNKAQWVYDSKIYYADVVNGKIDNSTMKRIEI